MKRLRIIFLCIVAVFAAIIAVLSLHRPLSSGTDTVRIGTAAVAVEVASTDAARERGLSGRVMLPDNNGMLFVFPQDGMWGFWMKDMHFSIDILWLDAQGNIITIMPLAAPDTYPQVFYPVSPARYVLELPSGFAALHGVQLGEHVTLPAGLPVTGQ